MIHTPHEYQRNYLTAIDAGWENFSRQLVVAPTGSGKTNMFCWTAEKVLAAGGRVLILVDQDELVWQPKERFAKLTGRVADVEKAEHHANVTSPLVIATVQSIMRRLDKYPADHFALIIADEADKSLSATWQRVLKHFDGTADVCGFTATPHRTDKRNLGEYYENPIELETLVSLIRKGFLSKIAIQQLPVKIDLTALTARAGDFNENELDEIITPYLEELAKSVQHYGSFRRTLVFLPLIKTCEKFTMIARDIGLNAAFTFGDDDQRKEKINHFRNWETDVLANSMLLTRGIDIPEVDCLGMFRPTKSKTLYSQMTGRGTRIAPSKVDCLLLDPLYQSAKMLVCNPAHLIGKTDEEIAQISELLSGDGMAMPADVLDQLDLVDLTVQADNAREEALRRKLEAHKDKQAKTISAEEFAIKFDSMEVAEYEPVMEWEQAEVTPKQRKHLERAGIDMATVKGNGHASKLLDIYFRTKAVKLASHSQRGLLKKLGHSSWEHATEAEFKKFMGARGKQLTEF